MSINSQNISLVKQAYIKIESLQEKIRSLEKPWTDPVAVIGIGCRFPGEANNHSIFWDNLTSGTDSITEIPENRWDVNNFYAPPPGEPGKIFTKFGGFIKNVDLFDAGLFNISPRESESMDPQHRIALEVCWEALEDAGISPTSLKGSQTGFYLGMASSDYSNLIQKVNDPRRFDLYYASGNAYSTASGRLSYLLGLHGPNFVLDTACSSSLVSVHLACQGILSGECDLALAGGINLILSPENLISYCNSGMISASGRCHTFDASADGFILGEGCGIVVLKRLSKAVEDRDNILAVIRGTAINHDGPSNGLTAPNRHAQEKVILRALSASGYSANDIGFIETHGTGTSLGDPIELQALYNVYTKSIARDKKLVVGSVKTNIGHLAASAGIASVIKVVLSLKNKKLPPHLHFNNPSPFIPWDKNKMRVPIQLENWEPISGKRVAGVSSFGFSGTNCHAIIEDAPTLEHPKSENKRKFHLFSLSSKKKDSLINLVGKYQDGLSENDPDIFADVCHTVNTGRTHFHNRLAILSESVESLKDNLLTFSSSGQSDRLFTRTAESGPKPDIVFLYSDLSFPSNHIEKELYDTNPVYRSAIDKCSILFEKYIDEHLSSILYSDHNSAANFWCDHPHGSPLKLPAAFSVQYATTQLWQSFGIIQSATYGYGLGELSALVSSGALSLESAIYIVAKLYQNLKNAPTDTESALVYTDVHTYNNTFASELKDVKMSAVISKNQIVLSGKESILESLLRKIEKHNIRFEKFDSTHARIIENITESPSEIHKIIRNISWQNQNIPIVSGIDGKYFSPKQVLPDKFFQKFLKGPVHCFEAIESIIRKNKNCVFLVIGDSQIPGYIHASNFEKADVLWLSSTNSGNTIWQQVFSSLAQLYVHGADVVWDQVDNGFLFNRVSLPTYSFNRKKYWIKPDTSHIIEYDSDYIAPTTTDDPYDTYPQISKIYISPLVKERIYKVDLSTKKGSFLLDYRIFGKSVLPASVIMELLYSTSSELFNESKISLCDIRFSHPLDILKDFSKTLQLLFEENDAKVINAKFIGFDHKNEKSNGCDLYAHCICTSADSNERINHNGNFKDAITTLHNSENMIPVMDLYKFYISNSIEIGQPFRAINNIWEAENVIKAELTDLTTHFNNNKRLGLSIVLDACLQIFGAYEFLKSLDASSRNYIPISLNKFRFHNNFSSPLHVYAYKTKSNFDCSEIKGDVLVYNRDNNICLELLGLTFRSTNRQTFEISKPVSSTDVYEKTELDKYGIERLSIEQIKTLEKNDQYEYLKKYIFGLFASVLGIEQSDINNDTFINELGFDSLMAGEVVSSIEHDFSFSLYFSDFLEDLTVTEFIDNLYSNLIPSNSPQSGEVISDLSSSAYLSQSEKLSSPNSPPQLDSDGNEDWLEGEI